MKRFSLKKVLILLSAVICMSVLFCATTFAADNTAEAAPVGQTSGITDAISAGASSDAAAPVVGGVVGNVAGATNGAALGTPVGAALGGVTGAGTGAAAGNVLGGPIGSAIGAATGALANTPIGTVVGAVNGAAASALPSTIAGTAIGGPIGSALGAVNSALVTTPVGAGLGALNGALTGAVPGAVAGAIPSAILNQGDKLGAAIGGAYAPLATIVTDGASTLGNIIPAKIESFAIAALADPMKLIGSTAMAAIQAPLFAFAGSHGVIRPHGAEIVMGLIGAHRFWAPIPTVATHITPIGQFGVTLTHLNNRVINATFGLLIGRAIDNVAGAIGGALIGAADGALKGFVISGLAGIGSRLAFSEIVNFVPEFLKVLPGKLIKHGILSDLFSSAASFLRHVKRPFGILTFINTELPFNIGFGVANAIIPALAGAKFGILRATGISGLIPALFAGIPYAIIHANAFDFPVDFLKSFSLKEFILHPLWLDRHINRYITMPLMNLVEFPSDWTISGLVTAFLAMINSGVAGILGAIAGFNRGLVRSLFIHQLVYAPIVAFLIPGGLVFKTVLLLTVIEPAAFAQAFIHSWKFTAWRIIVDAALLAGPTGILTWLIFRLPIFAIRMVNRFKGNFIKGVVKAKLFNAFVEGNLGALLGGLLGFNWGAGIGAVVGAPLALINAQLAKAVKDVFFANVAGVLNAWLVGIPVGIIGAMKVGFWNALWKSTKIKAAIAFPFVFFNKNIVDYLINGALLAIGFLPAIASGAILGEIADTLPGIVLGGLSGSVINGLANSVIGAVLANLAGNGIGALLGFIPGALALTAVLIPLNAVIGAALGAPIGATIAAVLGLGAGAVFGFVPGAIALALILTPINAIIGALLGAPLGAVAGALLGAPVGTVLGAVAGLVLNGASNNTSVTLPSVTEPAVVTVPTNTQTSTKDASSNEDASSNNVSARVANTDA